jgi:hypothetical protein
MFADSVDMMASEIIVDVADIVDTMTSDIIVDVS